MKNAEALVHAIQSATFAAFCGKVVAVGQGWVKADGPLASVGDYCQLGTQDSALLAEVVAVDEAGIRLLPLGSADGIRPGTLVRKSAEHSAFRAGPGFSGRAVDAFGRPIDGGPAIAAALAATKDFPGVAGVITIDADHNAVKSAVVLKIEKNKASYVTTINP